MHHNIEESKVYSLLVAKTKSACFNLPYRLLKLPSGYCVCVRSTCNHQC